MFELDIITDAEVRDFGTYELYGLRGKDIGIVYKTAKRDNTDVVLGGLVLESEFMGLRPDEHLSDVFPENSYRCDEDELAWAIMLFSNLRAANPDLGDLYASFYYFMGMYLQTKSTMGMPYFLKKTLFSEAWASFVIENAPNGIINFMMKILKNNEIFDRVIKHRYLVWSNKIGEEPLIYNTDSFEDAVALKLKWSGSLVDFSNQQLALP